MTPQEMTREIERLKAENARLAAAPAARVTYRVSQSGAVSFYGFGRFPITMFPRALFWLLDNAEAIRAWALQRFVCANGDWSLTKLGDTEQTEAVKRSAENEAKRNG